MRLTRVFTATALFATAFSTAALAHPGNHAHPHHSDTIGLGLAALLLATTVAAAGLPHVLRTVRNRRDTRR